MEAMMAPCWVLDIECGRKSLLALYRRTYLRMSDENHTLLLFVEKSLLEFVVEHNRPILRRVAEFPLNEAFAQVQEQAYDAISFRP